MQFQRVCIEALGYGLPAEIVSSAAIEERLSPLYSRLKLPAGRLELMSGIAERRLWPREMLPSVASVASGRNALAAAEIAPGKIGALVHGSVCRDYLEPATAAEVHFHLGLPRNCLVYDTSNACLGLLNGMLQVATLIELGHIQAGLVVGSEGSRELLETTIAALNADQSLTRETVKPAMASLTIGSASAAILLTSSAISSTGNRLLCATARVDSGGHALCRSGRDEAVASGMAPLMQTDAEALLHAGIAVGKEAYEEFLAEVSAAKGRANNITKTACHQVGVAHRKLMLESLGISPDIDYITYPWLGNTGSAALPVTLATGIERGFYRRGDLVALLGIGSGINVLMLAMELNSCPIRGGTLIPDS